MLPCYCSASEARISLLVPSFEVSNKSSPELSRHCTIPYAAAVYTCNMAAKKPTEFLYHKSGKEVNLPYTSYTLVLTVGILYNCKETSKQHEQPKHQSIQFLDYTIAHKKMWKEPNKHQHPNNHQPFHPSPTNNKNRAKLKSFTNLDFVWNN